MNTQAVMGGIPFQNMIGKAISAVPMGMRYGKAYRDTLRLLRFSQRWDREAIESFQVSELRKVLDHCVRHVPFYAEALKKAGLVPADFTRVGDISRLALTDKEIVSARQGDFRARNLEAKEFLPVTTGGSSGTPSRFFQQKGFSWERELAFIATLWERAGFRFGKDPRLVLRGAIVDHPGGIRYKAATREYICSTYRTDASHLDGYLDLLRGEKIRFIHGHVSSIALFAQHVISKGESVPLRAVLGGSEKVYPFQRGLVERAFGCRLFSWYGQSEQVALAGECEFSDKYHVFPEYGILELIDASGNPITAPGQIGEIVGTGFNNYAMPFIRYRTGDLAAFADGPCPACGRNYPLLERIEGRNFEYVVARSGFRVSLTGLIYGQHFRAFESIARMQVYQDAPGEIEIRIVPGPGFEAPEVEKELREKISAAMGSELEVRIEILESIAPSAAGKHKFLIQKLAMPAIDPAGEAKSGR